jgi:type IV secretory pathway TrbD component
MMIKRLSSEIILFAGVLCTVLIFIFLYLEIRLLALIGIPVSFIGLAISAYLMKAKRFGLYPFEATYFNRVEETKLADELRREDANEK